MHFAELCVLSVFSRGSVCVHPVSARGDLLYSSPAQCKCLLNADLDDTLFTLPFLRRPLAAAKEERDDGDAPKKVLRVPLPENAPFSDATCGDLWTKSCVFLLRELQRRASWLASAEGVIELGCGLALPSALCLIKNAQAVLATDGDEGALLLASLNLRLALGVRECLLASKDEALSAAKVASWAASVLQRPPAQGPQEDACLLWRLALPSLPPGVSTLRLKWNYTEALKAKDALRQLRKESRQGLESLAEEKSQLARLVVASDVVFCATSAQAVAEAFKALAVEKRNEEELKKDAEGKGECASSKPVLVMLSHETRHSWLWNKTEKRAFQEDVDSALQTFLAQFECIDSRARNYVGQSTVGAFEETQRSARLRAALLRVERERPPCNRCSECTRKRDEDEGPCCLGEGAICLIALSSDAALLQQLLFQEAGT